MSQDINQEAYDVEIANPQDEGSQASNVEGQEAQDDLNQEQRPSSNDQERNWKALRQKADEAERRAQEYERQLSEYNSLLRDVVSGKSQQQPQEEEFDESDIPTFGQTKKAIRTEAEKIAREIVRQTLEEKEEFEAPKKLKSEIADFDEVVTKENVDYLIKNEPELATILKNTKSQYLQGKVAYKFIKSLGLHNKDSVESMKKDAERNMAKPMSPNAVGNRNSVGAANMFAHGLTPDLKKQLYQEMLASAKRR